MTTLTWNVEEPGIIRARGTDFWIMYDPDCGANFAAFNGALSVAKAQILADAKLAVRNLVCDLVELALMEAPEG